MSPSAIHNEPPYCLRAPDGQTPEWYCIVAGRTYGPWPDKGTAAAGYATELRRAAARAQT